QNKKRRRPRLQSPSIYEFTGWAGLYDRAQITSTANSRGRRHGRVALVADLNASHAQGELLELIGLEVFTDALEPADQAVSQVLEMLAPVDVRSALHKPPGCVEGQFAKCRPPTSISGQRWQRNY